jgi:hypothetical protein
MAHPSPPATRFDHLLIAVPDFAEATARFRREYGLAAVEGGRHTGWGTANWIVPLGDSYLELVGVVDPEVATGNAFGRRVLRALDGGGGPFAWCLEPSDFEGTVERLDLEVTTGSRVRPDGATLRWRTAGRDVALEDPSRPFFIAWELPSRRDHPGRAVAAHGVVPRGIAWVEVAGDEAMVRGWLADDGLPVRVRPGPAALLAVGIATDGGEIVLR